MKPAKYKTLEDLERDFNEDMLGWRVSIDEHLAAFIGDEYEFKGHKYHKIKLNGHVLGCVSVEYGLKTGDVINLELAAVGLTSSNNMFLRLEEYDVLRNLCEASK